MKNMDGTAVPDGVKQVLSELERNHIPYQLRSFEAPARRARDAAALLDCPLGAVVKSLLFQEKSTGELFLALVSGENRADADLLKSLVGDSVRPAAPEVVNKMTGYPVGAVPPFGMKEAYRTFIDADLMAYELVWASAGASNILVGLAPEDLQLLSQGCVEVIKTNQRKKT